MTSTLSHFWQLASSSRDDRLRSAHALVKGLGSQDVGSSSLDLTKQSKQFEDGLKSGKAMDPEYVTDIELQEAEKSLEKLGSSDLVYSLKRLIKGLASHRESARVGFSVALCEIFSQNRILSAHHAITMILVYSTSSEKIRGQEERDMLFARMFGILALIRSGLLTDEKTATGQDFQRAIRILKDISNGKHWLRESATSVIVQAIEHLCSTASPPAWKSESLKWLVEKVCNDKRVTSDSVAIFMTLKQNAPEAFTTAQRLPHFGNQEVLATANLPVLARILRDANLDGGQNDEENGAEANQNGASIASGSTQAHFVWDIILKQYSKKSEKSTEAKQASFSSVFRILVDEGLFALTSSHQKKGWGFQVMQKALTLVDASYVPDIFMPNLMRTLVNSLSAKNSVLHKAAKKACIELQQAVKDRPTIAYDIFEQLTSSNGNLRFDSITGTKTVETILQSASSKDVRKISDQLIKMACEQESNGKRISILDLLLILVRNAQIDTDDECIQNALTFFAAHGLFKMTKPLEKASLEKSCLRIVPKNLNSSTFQSSCRSRFLSCLADLSVVPATAGPQSQDDVNWIERGSQIISSLDQDKGHFTRLPKTQQEIVNQSEKSMKVLQSAMKKADNDRKSRLSSLRKLILAATLYAQAAQLEEEAAKELIEPMSECANQLVQNAQPSHNEDGTPGPMDLLVDCLSNALQQPSAFLRSVATQTFDLFADQLTHSSMRLLIEQLGFNQQEGNEEESEESAEEEEGDEEDEEGFMSDASSTGSVSDIDEDDVDEEFAAKVREALKSGGVGEKDEDEEEEEASDEEEDDSSDSSSVSMENFDDEQMMLMDDKLADIFRQKHATRKQEDEARKEEVKFHIRIIDLLDHFAHRQSENGLCVELVLPLFTIAMEKEKALDQLRQRATTVLRKTLLKGGAGGKLNVVGKPSMESAAEALDAIHKLAATNLPAEQMALANSSNAYLTRACLNESNVPDEFRSVYAATLNDFMERKNNNLKPSFLIDAFSRFPFLGFSLREELLQAASGEQKTVQNAFRQIQVMEMLRGCISNLIGQIQQQQNASSKVDDKLINEIEELLKQLMQLIISRTKQDQHRIKEILKCGLIYVRLTRRLIEQVKGKSGKEAQAEIQAIWPLSDLQSAMDALESTNKMTNSSSLQGLLKQMIALTKTENKKENKRKKEEDVQSTLVQSSDQTNSKKKKAKKN